MYLSISNFCFLLFVPLTLQSQKLLNLMIMKNKCVLWLIGLLLSCSLFPLQSYASMENSRMKIIMKKNVQRGGVTRSALLLPFDIFQDGNSIVIDFFEPYEDMILTIYESDRVFCQTYVSVSLQEQEVVIPLDKDIPEGYTLELSTLSGECWSGEIIK